jgi:hypothetical protein
MGSVVSGGGWRGSLGSSLDNGGLSEKGWSCQQEAQSNPSACARHQIPHSPERLRFHSHCALLDFITAYRTSEGSISCVFVTKDPLPFAASASIQAAFGSKAA